MRKLVIFLILLTTPALSYSGSMPLFTNQFVCESNGYFWYNNACDDTPQIPKYITGSTFTFPDRKTLLFIFLSYSMDTSTGESGSGSIKIKWQEKDGVTFTTKSQTLSYSVNNIFITVDLNGAFYDFLKKETGAEVKTIDFAVGFDGKLYVVTPDIRSFLEKQGS